MTDTPVPPSVPDLLAPPPASFEPQEGTAIVATPGHFAAWAEKHLEPLLRDVRDDMADIRVKAGNADIKAEKALAWLKDHAANAEKLAALVARAVQAADPADATVIGRLLPEAEAIAAEAARIAWEVLTVA